MPSPWGTIQYSDLVALANLANTKLSPSTPYSFPAFAGSDQIDLPTDINPVATYGTGSWNPGQKNTLWLYGYRTIAGTKTYSWQPLVKAFYPNAASGNYSMAWTWTNPVTPNAPEGYIAVIPYVLGDGWQFIWKDIGLVATLTEDGSFSDPAWKFDQTLDQNNLGNPSQNLPCGHGAWLKPLNQIHSDLFNGMTLFGGSKVTFDPSFLLSGPWCVSVAQKCYLYLNSTSIYDNLEFWYSEADSTTGNELAPEADMLNTYGGGQNGSNSFNWTQNVTIKGRIILFSQPPGQSPSDWTLSGPPGVTTSFEPNYFDQLNFNVTALIFDFDDVPYSVGTPITITATPTAGGSIVNSGNPVGGGMWVNCVFTGDSSVYTASDGTAIHYAGKDIKKAALPNSLPQITFTSNIGMSNALDCHFRSFCDGVFVANTLPTLGLMTYLDQDLPQYDPQNDTVSPSSRRIVFDNALPPIPHVGNRGALWPVFRDTDFTPDSVGGQAVNGSMAWQVLGTKFVVPKSSTNQIAPSGVGNTIHTTILIPIAADNTILQQLRFFVDNLNCTLYVKAGAAPTISDYDLATPGGIWATLPYTPSPAGENWFVGILNPTSGTVTATSYAIEFFSLTGPNGSLFPVVLDDNNNWVPQHEGYSYHWWDNSSFEHLPIPQRGYCVYSITVRRQPVDNGSGIMIAPSTGTAALNVDIGLMQGWGFESAGTFQKIQTVTIAAGQSSVVTNVFLPVISSTPLAYQCSEQVQIRAAVNFQPQMHSSFDAVNVKVSGVDYSVGYFDGSPFYNPDYALIAFVGGNKQLPIVLPVAYTVYNDLYSLLGLLP